MLVGHDVDTMAKYKLVALLQLLLVVVVVRTVFGPEHSSNRPLQEMAASRILQNPLNENNQTYVCLLFYTHTNIQPENKASTNPLQLSLSLYIYIYIYICVCMCVSLSLSLCMYVCIYIYIHIHTEPLRRGPTACPARQIFS